MAPELQIGSRMKTLSDYQGIDLVRVDFNPELKKLHTAAESLVLAMRYVGIQTRNEADLETILRKLAFLDEIRGEIREASKGELDPSVTMKVSQWAFELSLVAEEGELSQIHDFLDSLFRCFADACVWLEQVLEADESDASRSAGIEETYHKLVEFVGCGALTIISGSGAVFERRAS